MTNITDAQKLAIFNSQGEALGVADSQFVGLNIAETVVSGTPFQVSTVHDADLYLSIQTAASLTVSMGPEAAGTSIPVAAAAVDAIGIVHLFVPKGWYVKLTGTVADFTVNAVLR